MCCGPTPQTVVSGTVSVRVMLWTQLQLDQKAVSPFQRLADTLVAFPQNQELRLQARQLFLVDAACDAANHHYRMKHGTDFATSSADLQASAQQGIYMLFRALQMPGDPMHIQHKLSEKVDEHLILLKKRIIKLRVAQEKEKRRKQQQKQAEAKAAAAAEAKRKKDSQYRSVFVAVLLLALAAAWVQSMQGSL